MKTAKIMRHLLAALALTSGLALSAPLAHAGGAPSCCATPSACCKTQADCCKTPNDFCKPDGTGDCCKAKKDCCAKADGCKKAA